MDLSSFESIFWLAIATFVVAGTVKGVVGIGLPITAIGIMSQLSEPRLAITLAIFPIVAGNAWQVYRSGHVLEAIRKYWPFAATLAVSMLITTFFVTSVSAELLLIMLGLVIVLFSIINLAIITPELPERFDTIGQVVAATFSGLFGGLTAIWAPPMVIYFISRRLDKDEFIRASGVLFLAGSAPLLIGYINNGLIDGPIAQMSALLILPTIVGFTLGEYLRRRMNAERFRTAVLVIFLLMGLNLLRRAIF